MNAPQIYYSASTIIVKIISLHRIIDYTDPSFHFWHFNFHELISPFSQTRSIFQFPSRRISRCCEGKISVFLEGRAGEKERQGEGEVGVTPALFNRPFPVFGSGVLFHLCRARQSAFERLRRGYESLPTSEKSNFPFLFLATNVFITGHA